MRAGRLRHRLVIERRVATKDATGQPVESWAVFATAWGLVEQVGGREAERAHAVSAEARWKITTRHIDGVDSGMRIKSRGVTLDIVAPPVDVGGRRVKMEIYAKEHEPAGVTS